MFTTAKVREPVLSFDKYHENIADELIDYAIQLCENVEKE
jgi:hypothetical protein